MTTRFCEKQTTAPMLLRVLLLLPSLIQTSKCVWLSGWRQVDINDVLSRQDYSLEHLHALVSSQKPVKTSEDTLRVALKNYRGSMTLDLLARHFGVRPRIGDLDFAIRLYSTRVSGHRRILEADIQFLVTRYNAPVSNSTVQLCLNAYLPETLLNAILKYADFSEGQVSISERILIDAMEQDLPIETIRWMRRRGAPMTSVIMGHPNFRQYQDAFITDIWLKYARILE